MDRMVAREGKLDAECNWLRGKKRWAERFVVYKIQCRDYTRELAVELSVTSPHRD